MEYMLIIATDRDMREPKPGEPGFEEFVGAWGEFTRELMSAGVFVDGAGLQPVDTATTVRRTAGAEPTIIDGPFAETKEQLGGYYRIEVADLDAALEWATRIPIPAGAVEVRPIDQMPDADGAPTPANA